MKVFKYRIRFLTPAFLGDAQQNGRWRTPPFKALIRQWWRVVWAAENGFPDDYKPMRVEEGLLFGNAWLANNYRKSLLRLRLTRWDPGSLTRQKWGLKEGPVAEKVQHPEVGQRIGPLLYLGYGPLLTERAGRDWATVLKNQTAIDSGESAELWLGLPESHPQPEIDKILKQNVPRLTRVMELIHLFGTVGGRSRNGWGSLELEPVDGVFQFGANPLPSQDWVTALKFDWPHSLGASGQRPLIWRTSNSYADWITVMRDLAILKMALRTQFGFPPTPPPHATVEDRHILSYPITKHITKAWDRSFRLPNSLRFKVRRDPQNGERLIGLIYHMPCSPPPAFRHAPGQPEKVWKAVHGLLAELCTPAANRKYASVGSAKWKTCMPQQLRSIQLQPF